LPFKNGPVSGQTLRKKMNTKFCHHHATWAVCPHILEGEYLAKRYEKFGGVTFVAGVVLCDDCYDARAKGKIEETLENCRSLCDDCLRLFVIDSLCAVNSQVHAKKTHS
jgi:hypothetical protein